MCAKLLRGVTQSSFIAKDEFTRCILFVFGAIPMYKRTMISPFSVNLMALLMEFNKTCCTRMASPKTVFGTPSSTWYPTFNFNLPAWIPTISNTFAMTPSGLNGSLAKDNFSASTREKSRMSLINACKVSPDDCMVVTKSLCVRSNFVSSNNCPTAINPFKGVRISCDICAKNFDFDSVAALAMATRFKASISAFCESTILVTSD